MFKSRLSWGLAPVSWEMLMSSAFGAMCVSGEVAFRLFTFCTSLERLANPLGQLDMQRGTRDLYKTREDEVKVVGAGWAEDMETTSRPTERGAWGRRKRGSWVAAVTLRPARPCPRAAA